ncbi:MAG: hypothetical protein KTV68_00765 [Acidimicrobiia bacterium]|nr:hypothetical protein [Acidimicrobiia bacterium]MCY4435395.1 hypothetical protein [bacterium]
MFIAIADTITLEDESNFREFHVAIDGDVAAAVAAFGGRAAASERDNHLWIDIAFVRDLAGDAADAEWQAQFDGMLAYANSKGWIDEAANRVEAHIQPPG